VIGNEFADAKAKYAALHNDGHEEAFPPPSPDGNPFAHIYWLAEEKNETTHTTIKFNLAPLQNIKDKLKAHMSKHHGLGDANTNYYYGYFYYWKRLLTSVNLTTSNSFWNNTVSQKRNVMKFRTGGTLYTQKMAHLYGRLCRPRATSSKFILSAVSSARQPNSYAFWLSACFNSKHGD